MFRFVSSTIILNVAFATLVYGLLYFAVVGIYGIQGDPSIHGLQGIPRSIGIIQPVILFLGISASRLIIMYLYVNTFSYTNFKNKKNVLIYGLKKTYVHCVIKFRN